MVSRDENRPGIRYMYPIKSSLAPEGCAMAFTFKDEGGIEWLGKYDLNGTMIPEGELVKTSKREKARAKMVQMLQDGDLPGKDVYAALAAIGVGSRTVEKVKKEFVYELE